jgi:hypothetical protein
MPLHPTRLRGRAALAAALALAAASCHGAGTTVLVVTVGLSGSLPPVTGLGVRVIAPAGSADQTYGGAAPIVFPTTFTAELPSRITGDLTLEVKATGADGKVVATGRSAAFTVRVGARQNVLVKLDCGNLPCSISGADGGATLDAASDGSTDSNCGNGRIDVGETCDTAIAPGAPGACPPASCDDGIACTTDTRVGQGCQARCVYQEITARAAGDKCCPKGATNADDADCSATCGNGAVEAGELCDTAIADGAPGACPGLTSCDDGDPCTSDELVAAGTCAAVCAHIPVTETSTTETDGCCRAGASHAADPDCPASCGDGEIDPPELCDPGFQAPDPRACKVSCDDGDPCTRDVRQGFACQVSCTNTPITELVSGDGCCPPGANGRTDRDCPATCGNGAVEPGESCDNGPGSPKPCPRSCDPVPSACLRNLLVGDATKCTARCELSEVPTCGGARDGCCPTGCTSTTDPDCSASCGDGMLQPGEVCDTAIPAGHPGACPTACSDGAACTRDVLVSAGTCQATCLSFLITEPRAGDGCCPADSDALLDPDCPAKCGNHVVEPPSETCEIVLGIAACPNGCSGGSVCTSVKLEGNVAGCTAHCVAHPITACVSKDQCCPAWCTIANDSDCPVICGDGIVSTGESCDRAITTGLPGACPASCDDSDACTIDRARGTVEGCTRACSHAKVTACRAGDGCCPPGCTAASDADCAPKCGDGQLGAGETCDPPSSCPAVCPDDHDPCTREVLVGDPKLCTAACRHEPITTCSGATADFCCPSPCTASSDVDCPVVGPDQ